MSEKVEYVTITFDEYKYLLDRLGFLNCLEAVGVDNWEGYGDAWEMYEEEDGEE